MRPHVHKFVKEVLDADPWRARDYSKIVEFGSYQVGADLKLRDLVSGRDYLGVDYREGPNVDKVDDLHTLDPYQKCYDNTGIVLCCETLEHVEKPWLALANIRKILSRGYEPGLCVVTVPFIFGIHSHPHDYWRCTPTALESLFALAGFRGYAVSQDPPHPNAYPHTVVGVACAEGPVPDAVMKVVEGGSWRTNAANVVVVPFDRPATALSFDNAEEQALFEREFPAWWKTKWPKK